MPLLLGMEWCEMILITGYIEDRGISLGVQAMIV